MWHCVRAAEALVLKSMGRESLAVGDETVSEQFGELMHSFERALPPHTDPARFNELAAEARAQGLDWVQGMAYAAARRPPAHSGLGRSRSRLTGSGVR